MTSSSRALSRLCQRLWWQSRLLDTLLLWSPVRGLHPLSPDLWPSDERLIPSLMQGQFTFYGEEFQGSESNLWEPYGISEDSLAALHQFEWLGTLRALGNQEARILGRSLVSHWIQKNRQWTPLAWRADVIGKRLSAWLGYYDFFGSSADQEFRRRFYKSLARQSLYLRFMDTKGLPPFARLQGLLGLAMSQLAIPGQEKTLEVTMNSLYQSLTHHLLEDGLHVSRNPSLQADILKNLVRIRSNLRQGNIAKEYPFIQNTIERMAPMLRFFRHGDGALGIFNGGEELAPDLIDMILSQTDARGRPPESSLSSGFDRLNSHKSLLLIDTGIPGEETLGSAGSFEFSQGRQRILVNCGQARGGYKRFTSSDFVFKNQNNFFLEAAHGPIRGQKLQRKESEGAHLLVVENRWPQESHSLRHQRTFYLSADGTDLRGQEEVSGPMPSGGWSLKFHGAPGIKISPTPLKTVWVFQKEDQVWHFQCSENAHVRWEEGIYLGKGFQPCAALKIEGESSSTPLLFKWAFKKQS